MFIHIPERKTFDCAGYKVKAVVLYPDKNYGIDKDLDGNVFMACQVDVEGKLLGFDVYLSPEAMEDTAFVEAYIFQQYIEPLGKAFVKL